MDADHDATLRRLNFVFHFHGFNDQHTVPRFNCIPDFGFDLNDGAGHGGSHAALMGWARAAGDGCFFGSLFFAAALAAGNFNFIQRFYYGFFRNSIYGNIERTLGFPVVSAAGEFNMEGFAM